MRLDFFLLEIEACKKLAILVVCMLVCIGEKRSHALSHGSLSHGAADWFSFVSAAYKLTAHFASACHSSCSML